MFIPEKNYSFYEDNPKGKLTIKKFVKEMYYRLMYDEISLLSSLHILKSTNNFY